MKFQGALLWYEIVLKLTLDVENLVPEVEG